MAHKFRLYRFRQRDVVLLEKKGECWRVRFVEHERLEHTALVDSRELQPTPFIFTWPILGVKS